MDNYRKKINIISIDGKNTLKICFATLAIYFLVNLIFKWKFNQVSVALRIYYLVGMVIFSILSKQVFHLYKYNKYNYIYMYIYCLAYVILFGHSIQLTSDSNYSAEILTNFIILFELYFGFKTIEYNHKTGEKSYIIYIVLKIFCILTLVLYYKIFDIISIVVFLSCIECFLIYKIFINNDSKSYNQFNINTYLVLVALIPIASFFSLFMYPLNGILLRFREILLLSVFNIFFSMFFKNFMRNPYKELAESLNKKNKILDELSEDIFIKNKELETSILNLKNKEYLYETFFRFMPHPIILISLENNRILFANKAFLNLVDVKNVRDVINKKINKYIHFVTSSNDTDLIFNAILSSKTEERFVNAKFLSMYKDKMEDLILIEDNTSKVLTEEIKKEVESRMVEERIRTEFLSSISHDLKTPINVIYSSIQVQRIYTNKNDIKSLEKYNSISKMNCISLIKLTNNLIDMSKINSNFLMPNLEMINVVETTEDIVTSLVDYAQSNSIEIIFNTNTEESYLNLDYEFLQRIILNLISNSIKFTPIDGKIIIDILDEEESVKISIMDNGAGMNEEFIKEAFCKYSMDKYSKKSKKGTGIGLFVVKKLVELQSGKIEIKSKLGEGTKITIIFPKENLDEEDATRFKSK
ncbi:HAMP domain-containing histidine kinase [Clostridium botulinum]|nr:HAMP domain-containing histidine kinase [Clostridium botulinum]NFS95286.1 HAMP domain-containing histidine kinase [Clostridium botulinum]